MRGGMSGKDFVGYVISLCVGALIGAGILAAIFNLGGVTDMTGGFGSNGLVGVNGSAAAGLPVGVHRRALRGRGPGGRGLQGHQKLILSSQDHPQSGWPAQAL